MAYLTSPYYIGYHIIECYSQLPSFYATIYMVHWPNYTCRSNISVLLAALDCPQTLYFNRVNHSEHNRPILSGYHTLIFIDVSMRLRAVDNTIKYALF